MRKLNLSASFCVGIFGLFATNVYVAEASDRTEVGRNANLEEQKTEAISAIDQVIEKVEEKQKVSAIVDRGIKALNEAKELRLVKLKEEIAVLERKAAVLLVPFITNSAFMRDMSAAYYVFFCSIDESTPQKKDAMNGARGILQDRFELYKKIFLFFLLSKTDACDDLMKLVSGRQIVDADGISVLMHYLLSTINPTEIASPTLKLSFDMSLINAIGDLAVRENQNTDNFAVRDFQSRLSNYFATQLGVDRAIADRRTAIFSVILGSTSLIERLQRNESGAILEAQNRVRDFLELPPVRQQGGQQTSPQSAAAGTPTNAYPGTTFPSFIESIFGLSTLFMNSIQSAQQNVPNSSRTFNIGFSGNKK